MNEKELRKIIREESNNNQKKNDTENCNLLFPALEAWSKFMIEKENEHGCDRSIKKS